MSEKGKDLDDIRNQILDLLDEAKRIIRTDKNAWERAKAYWWGQIATALAHEDYIKEPITIQETIQELGGTEAEDNWKCEDCNHTFFDDDDEDEGCPECGSENIVEYYPGEEDDE